VRLGIDASFDDNTSTFQGNNVDVYVDGGTITQDVTWNLKRDYSLFISSGITIAAGAVLSINPGTVVKFAQYGFLTVYGELYAVGNTGAPIFFTDWRDDTAGGDANHDGNATQPGPGWWWLIEIRNAGSATL